MLSCQHCKGRVLAHELDFPGSELQSLMRRLLLNHIVPHAFPRPESGHTAALQPLLPPLCSFALQLGALSRCCVLTICFPSLCCCDEVASPAPVSVPSLRLPMFAAAAMCGRLLLLFMPPQRGLCLVRCALRGAACACICCAREPCCFEIPFLLPMLIVLLTPLLLLSSRAMFGVACCSFDAHGSPLFVQHVLFLAACCCLVRQRRTRLPLRPLPLQQRFLLILIFLLRSSRSRCRCARWRVLLPAREPFCSCSSAAARVAPASASLLAPSPVLSASDAGAYADVRTAPAAVPGVAASSSADATPATPWAQVPRECCLLSLPFVTLLVSFAVIAAEAARASPLENYRCLFPLPLPPSLHLQLAAAPAAPASAVAALSLQLPLPLPLLPILMHLLRTPSAGARSGAVPFSSLVTCPAPRL